jgi:multiple sugar transport system ATP-binding protein
MGQVVSASGRDLSICAISAETPGYVGADGRVTTEAYIAYATPAATGALPYSHSFGGWFMSWGGERTAVIPYSMALALYGTDRPEGARITAGSEDCAVVGVYRDNFGFLSEISGDGTPRVFLSGAATEESLQAVVMYVTGADTDSAQILHQRAAGAMRANPRGDVTDWGRRAALAESLRYLLLLMCGKSTTLRMIAGLEDITSGEIRIGERVVNGVPPKDRDIAMVFQSYALYPHMTAYRNMAYGLRLRRTPKDEIDRRVRGAARILEIEHLLDRLPKALSGGERQRVALGRAMVREPAVFLFDEPLSNIDAKLRASMRTEIRKLHERLGATFVFVTHDQTEAMTMGDRIVVMNDGVIQQQGTPEEVYNHPGNVFTGGFIGSPQMNFIDGILHKQQTGGYAVSFGTEHVSVSPEAPVSALDGYEGKPVKLGIRPEDIRTAEDGGPLAAVLDARELLGSDAYLYLNYGGARVTARVAPDVCADARAGDTIKIGINPYRAHLFDIDTEQII